MNIQYGWKCPSCGAVMAPWQNSCVNCSGEKQSTPNITWTSTNPSQWEITCGKNDMITNSTVTIPADKITLQDQLKTSLNSNKITY